MGVFLSFTSPLVGVKSWRYDGWDGRFTGVAVVAAAIRCSPINRANSAVHKFTLSMGVGYCLRARAWLNLHGNSFIGFNSLNQSPVH